MYGTTEQVIRQHHENPRREAARLIPAPMALEDHETRPYVVRDLSWELARFLDTQDLPVVALDTPGGANGNSLQPE